MHARRSHRCERDKPRREIFPTRATRAAPRIRGGRRVAGRVRAMTRWFVVDVIEGRVGRRPENASDERVNMYEMRCGRGGMCVPSFSRLVTCVAFVSGSGDR